jgi:hypothetical protein
VGGQAPTCSGSEAPAVTLCLTTVAAHATRHRTACAASCTTCPSGAASACCRGRYLMFRRMAKRRPVSTSCGSSECAKVCLSLCLRNPIHFNRFRARRCLVTKCKFLRPVCTVACHDSFFKNCLSARLSEAPPWAPLGTNATAAASAAAARVWRPMPWGLLTHRLWVRGEPSCRQCGSAGEVPYQ